MEEVVSGEGAAGAEGSWDLVIEGARLLDGDGSVEIAVKAGKIAAFVPWVEGDAARRVEARGGLVTPSFTEPHFHLDKCLSRDLLGATKPSEAFARAREVKSQFTVEDVEERASKALALAIANGIGHLRAMVDVDFATKLISLEGVLRARERYGHAIEVEIAAFPQEGIVTDPEAPALLKTALEMGADLLGGLPEFENSLEDQQSHIDTLFDIAEAEGVAIDIHCDYMDDPKLKTLEMLVDTMVTRRFEHGVIANHCNALALYPDDEAKRVIDKVKNAGIDVVVLPVANLQMLGGAKRTPYNRGSSRVKELLDAGVNVAAGSDNMYDIWYRFNRMDPLELAFITCLSAGMKTDVEVQTAFEMVTSRAARAVGRKAGEMRVGAPADLVIHEPATLVDLIRNPPGRRLHLKGGKEVGGLEGSHWAAEG
ncbi:MAG: amidohydrolase family protein [Proteobacteria bacterium]|nr:amidohydrolase family protein [Pseudomonadota bacterium]